MCRASAEDVVQTALMRLLESSEPIHNPVGYLFSSVRNTAIDCLRRRKQSTADPAVLAAPENAECLIAPARLNLALESLHPEQRETILLKIYGGLTFADIAELLECSPNTVASWYRRGLQKLKGHLEAVP